MWKEENNKLYKKFTFKNFSEAFAFMTELLLKQKKWIIILHGQIPGIRLRSG